MKIVVIGPPSSGKTTFATQLQKLLGINYIKADDLYWRNGEESNLLQFKKIIAEKASTPDWVFEGHVTKVFDILLVQLPMIVVIKETPWDFLNALSKDLQRMIFGDDRVRARKRFFHHLTSWRKVRVMRKNVIDSYSQSSPKNIFFWDRRTESFEELVKRTNIVTSVRLSI